MFNRKPKVELPNYQEQIETAKAQLDNYDADSKEYNTILKRLERLEALNAPLKKEREARRVSPDAILTAAVPVAITIMVLAYEHAAPIVSKSFQLALRSIK